MKDIIKKQKDFFQSGATLSTKARLNNLLKFQSALKEYNDKLLVALKSDLNKSEIESFLAELSLVNSELKFAIKNIAKWNKPKRTFSSNSIRPAKSYIYHAPYGVVLILGPWNYPVQLSLLPLVGALACGNTVILKTSRNSKAVSEVIHEMISKTFDENLVYHVPSNIEYDLLLDNNFDFIFFTGSPGVGKKIMKNAAENLTPVILELGGKSPCIIDKDANIEIAAKRVLFGKLFNAGQTCVAPDYFLVHKSVKEEFISNLTKQIKQFYDEPCFNDQYVKIVNKKHFDRLISLIKNHAERKQVIGGKYNEQTNQISPAIFLDTDFNDEIMEKEIFGPIFPIIEYESLDEILKQIKKYPPPLAFYFFSKDIKLAKKTIAMMQYGGCCINDCIVHLSNENLPFGGFKNSGIGKYHGKYSFESFTHINAVVINKPSFDLPLRYPPYTDKKVKFLKMLLK